MTSQELPVRVAFKLKGIVITLQSELDKYDSIVQSLIQKHSNKRKNGKPDLDEAGNPRFTESGYNSFREELEELDSIEIDVEAVNLDELYEENTLSIDDAIALDGFIV